LEDERQQNEILRDKIHQLENEVSQVVSKAHLWFCLD